VHHRLAVRAEIGLLDRQAARIDLVADAENAQRAGTGLAAGAQVIYGLDKAVVGPREANVTDAGAGADPRKTMRVDEMARVARVVLERPDDVAIAVGGDLFG